MEHIGKHALITGGGTGIGRDFAEALANAGADVTITERRRDVLAEVAVTRHRLHALQMDVTDEGSVRTGMSQITKERGRIEICIANAGIAEGGAFAKVSLADWRRSMITNLDDVFLAFQAAFATLPQETSGRMIVVSSIAGVRGLKGAIPYTVTKHCVIGLIRGLSEEYLSRPVTFNALCPGHVETDIVRDQLPGLMRRFDVDEAGARTMIAQGNRHQKLLHVNEITAATLWLCSDGARSVNGQTIEISGGQV